VLTNEVKRFYNDLISSIKKVLKVREFKAREKKRQKLKELEEQEKKDQNAFEELKEEKVQNSKEE